MKLLNRLFFAVLILAAVAGGVMAAEKKDEPTIRASVDKKAILIGDRIRLTIEVKSKGGLEFLFPGVKTDTDEAAKIGDFEIKDSGISVKKGIFGRYAVTKWYIITSYTVGLQSIPPLEVKYRPRKTKDFYSLLTQPIAITVASILPKDTPLSDVKDIKGPISFFEINWIFVAILIIFIICIILFIRYKRKKAMAPVRLPHETALEELEALKGIMAQGGGIKEYYVGVSDCIRRYIERVFKLKAPEMTTEEFLNSLRESGTLSLEQKDLLKDFLRSCDLVKFAKYAPTRKEIESVHETAKKFIEETKSIGYEK